MPLISVCCDDGGYQNHRTVVASQYTNRVGSELAPKLLDDLGDGDNFVRASNGNDTVTTGADVLNLSNGDDTATAGPGDDRINAGSGIDTVDAGEGTDTCYGEESATSCEL